MTHFIDWIIVGVFLAIVFGTIVNFFDVTLWQCRKFGNCPWYLEWMNND